MSTYCEFLNPNQHKETLGDLLNRNFSTIIEEHDVVELTEVEPTAEEIIEVKDHSTTLQGFMNRMFSKAVVDY